MSEMEGITTFMKTLLGEYGQLRGKKKDSGCRPFWDLVVITTADSAQKEAFELQINEKFQRKELPIDLTFIVVPDPPGSRIGNGGSTLTALEFLDKLYGSEMYKQKILLIHAGGWSQRMPSSSILGKIFSVLPHGHPPYQMLDLKLALYWPFVERIEPGVFLVCADDFLMYSFSSDIEWKIPANGFTALAHPSPVVIGRMHGVFVIKSIADIDPVNPVVICECLEVLQKPTDERMKLHGAMLKEDTHDFADGIHIQGDVVYTDSSFYFGVDIMQILLNFKKSFGNLSCEIDAYGDFLQAVGSCATNEYIYVTSNVSQMTPNLLQMRQRVFDCLNGCDIHVLVMNASVFVHIGTMKELQHHFCQDQNFQKQLALGKDVFNVWNNWFLDEKYPGSQCYTSKQVKRNPEKISPSTCIIHSCLNSESTINEDCFLEFCDFELPVNIHEKCIISNCQLLWHEMVDYNDRLAIPEMTFLHTVPVNVGNQVKYVTVYFSLNDNLKKSASISHLESLPFMGSDIGHFMEEQGLLKEDILPNNSQSRSENISGSFHSDPPQPKQIVDSEVSLWTLKLYPAATSMTASLEGALHALSAAHRGRSKKESITLFSFADLLLSKNVKVMLNFRKTLFEKISS